jgi:hypothetical protein
MNEIHPGLWHWTTHHEPIGARVSSYFVEPAGIVIDPKIPDGGLQVAFAGRPAPQQVVLTSGLHDRDAEAFAEHFGIPIRAPREARDRVGDSLDFTPYDHHDELLPGVVAIQIDVLCPDEYSLHLADVGPGALTVADAITRYGGALGFVPDSLLGAHPDRIKNGLKNRFNAQLEREWDALLFAHGEPIAEGGKEALRKFVRSPVGHPEFGQAL